MYIDFFNNLERKIEKKLDEIESSDLNVLKKSFEASLVLSDAYFRLKEFISTYTFQSEAEEIEFFKIIKPRLCCLLIYYRKIYNIEMNRPMGVESQRAYLQEEIKAINRYNSKRSDFVRYYRSGLTHLDSIYYLRGKIDTALYLESFQYERDPMFSTNCDFKVARILANDKLFLYLTKELEVFEQHQVEHSFPHVRITWNGTKTELIEQLFAWDSRKVFGNVPLTKLVEYIQMVFNIELDRNVFRTFSEMRLRNNKTPFMDSMKFALLKRMNHWDDSKSKKRNS